jgi:hypothetical protein
MDRNEWTRWQRVRFFLLTKGLLGLIVTVLVAGTVLGFRAMYSCKTNMEISDMESRTVVEARVIRAWFRDGVDDGTGCGGGSADDYGAVVKYKGRNVLVKLSRCYDKVDRVRLLMIPGASVSFAVKRGQLSGDKWDGWCDDVMRAY